MRNEEGVRADESEAGLPPLDGGDGALRDLDRRRRWPIVAALAGVVLLVILVRACIPVVEDAIDETRLEVERNRGDRPDAVADDLAAMCIELAGPLEAHLAASDPIDAIPEAAEVLRVLEEHLRTLPLVRGQLDTRRDVGFEDLAETRATLDEVAATDGSPEQLDALRRHARLAVRSAVLLVGLDEGGVLAELAARVPACRDVVPSLPEMLAP